MQPSQIVTCSGFKVCLSGSKTEQKFRYEPKDLPFIEGQTRIDLYKVFRNEMLKTSIFKNKYRSLKLNDVSIALLGKGKLSDIDGENARSKSVNEQKQYLRANS